MFRVTVCFGPPWPTLLINDIQQQLLRVSPGTCRESADIRRTLLKVSEFGGYLDKKGRCRQKFPSLEKGAKQEPRKANQLAPLRDIRKRNERTVEAYPRRQLQRRDIHSNYLGFYSYSSA